MPEVVPQCDQVGVLLQQLGEVVGQLGQQVVVGLEGPEQCKGDSLISFSIDRFRQSKTNPNQGDLEIILETFSCVGSWCIFVAPEEPEQPEELGVDGGEQVVGEDEGLEALVVHPHHLQVVIGCLCA